MTFESITEIWTYRTQRDVVWEHYRNLNLLHSTRCRLRALQKSELIALTICRLRALQASELIALNETCRLRALQKSELIALNEMSFESITEIWTYCTQRYDVWENYRNLNLLTKRDVAWEYYRRFNLFQSTIWRFRALQKSERITLNHVSFESITEIWTYCTQRDVAWEHYRNLNLLH